MSKQHREVIRELDLDCLSREQQAALCEAHGDLRGTVKQIDGSLTKVRGRLQCSNAMIAPHSIRTELVMIEAQARAAIKAIDKLSA